MPIYEYKCAKCEHEFERSQRITDAPVKTCPQCKSRRVKKLISQTSFVLKGGGWYADGYGSKTESANAKDASSGDSSSDASSTSTDKPDKADKADKAAASDSKPADAGSGKAEKSGGSDSKKKKSKKGSGKAAA
jgi:putative FmdB family regulatory protein